METVAAKLPPDLAEQVEQYREDHGLNKSQAFRRLVEDGLEHEEQPQGIVVTKPAAIALIGWFLIAVDWITVAPGQPVGWVGVALLLAAVVYGVLRNPVYRREKPSTDGSNNL